VQALVYEKDGRRIGVVVNQILDTVEETLSHLNVAEGAGVTGSFPIRGRVTEIIDLDALCADTRVGTAMLPADAGVAA
jgi:two-component system chemotaxis sensor kinase CheA